MFRIEFTIEPFTEGTPGRHVTAAIDAVESCGVVVDVGPFGSSCTVDADRVAEIVGIVAAVSTGHGADHVNLDVTHLDVTHPDAARPEDGGDLR